MSLLDDQRSARPGPRSQERTSEHGRAPLQGAGPVPARTAGQERAAPVPGATPQQLERVEARVEVEVALGQAHVVADDLRL